METIKLSKDDVEFLKHLQQELNTQDNDGQADPIFWGVMERRTVCVPEGCGEVMVSIDGDIMTLEDAVEHIQSEYIDDENGELWQQVATDDYDEVVDFCCSELSLDARVVYTQEQDILSTNTGAFLTKKACQDYIRTFGYNHCNPRTYAMTAYRNFELGSLLKILKNMKFEEEEKVEKPETEIEHSYFVSVEVSTSHGINKDSTIVKCKPEDISWNVRKIKWSSERFSLTITNVVKLD